MEKIVIKRKGRPKKKREEKKHFAIINADCQYFAGFERGGKFKWTYDAAEAKKFQELDKFESFKKWYPRQIIIDWL